MAAMLLFEAVVDLKECTGILPFAWVFQLHRSAGKYYGPLVYVVMVEQMRVSILKAWLHSSSVQAARSDVFNDGLNPRPVGEKI